VIHIEIENLCSANICPSICIAFSRKVITPLFLSYLHAQIRALERDSVYEHDANVSSTQNNSVACIRLLKFYFVRHFAYKRILQKLFSYVIREVIIFCKMPTFIKTQEKLAAIKTFRMLG